MEKRLTSTGAPVVPYRSRQEKTSHVHSIGRRSFHHTHSPLAESARASLPNKDDREQRTKSGDSSSDSDDESSESESDHEERTRTKKLGAFVAPVVQCLDSGTSCAPPISPIVENLASKLSYTADKMLTKWLYTRMWAFAAIAGFVAIAVVYFVVMTAKVRACRAITQETMFLRNTHQTITAHQCIDNRKYLCFARYEADKATITKLSTNDVRSISCTLPGIALAVPRSKCADAACVCGDDGINSWVFVCDNTMPIRRMSFIPPSRAGSTLLVVVTETTSCNSSWFPSTCRI